MVDGGEEGLVVGDHLVVQVSNDHLPDSHLSAPGKFSDDWHTVVNNPCTKGDHYELSYY